MAARGGSARLERNAGAIRRAIAVAARDGRWESAGRRPVRRATTGGARVAAVGGTVRRGVGMAAPGDPVRRWNPLLAVATVAAAPSWRPGRAQARVAGARDRRADRGVSAHRAARRSDPGGHVRGGRG